MMPATGIWPQLVAGILAAPPGFGGLPSGYKRCLMCRHVLPLAKFNRSAKHRGGYENACRPCYRARREGEEKRPT